jgi:hypothetical protein
MRQRGQATLTFVVMAGVSGFGQGCETHKASVSDADIVDAVMTGNGGGTGARGGWEGRSGSAAIDGGRGNGASGTGGRSGEGGRGAGGGGASGSGSGGSWFDSFDGPLACVKLGCPAAQFCASVVWNGITNVNRCLPLPDNCVDCACAQAALAAYYAARFPLPQRLPRDCRCWDDGNHAADGGTVPVAGVLCSGG